jgi:putative NADH-flavin reductase
MKIVVFGTGFVGSALATELAARGHAVLAVARHPDPALPEKLPTIDGDVHDSAFVARTVDGADVVISALAPVDDEGGLPASTEALIEAVRVGGQRLVVVGSSTILPVVAGGAIGAEGPVPDFLVARVKAHAATLELLQTAPASVDWTYLAVAVEFGRHAPGTRTGSYRTSTSTQVRDATGRSAIGIADYATAVADQLDTPSVHRGWLATGY